MNPMPEQLLHWGADNAGAVLLNSEWWRIVTAMFVHVGILHLATNMWCLWNLGLLAEPLMGSIGVFAVYILTGAAGNLLSTVVNWFLYRGWESPYTLFGPVGAGASGAVFGIAGALIVLLKSQRLPVPPMELKKLRKSVIYFAAINLVIGFSISGGTRVFRRGHHDRQYGASGRLRLRPDLRGTHDSATRIAQAGFRIALARCGRNGRGIACAVRVLSCAVAEIVAAALAPIVQKLRARHHI